MGMMDIRCAFHRTRYLSARQIIDYAYSGGDCTLALATSHPQSTPALLKPQAKISALAFLPEERKPAISVSSSTTNQPPAYNPLSTPSPSRSVPFRVIFVVAFPRGFYHLYFCVRTAFPHPTWVSRKFHGPCARRLRFRNASSPQGTR